MLISKSQVLLMMVEEIRVNSYPWWNMLKNMFGSPPKKDRFMACKKKTILLLLLRKTPVDFGGRYFNCHFRSLLVTKKTCWPSDSWFPNFCVDWDPQEIWPWETRHFHLSSAIWVLLEFWGKLSKHYSQNLFGNRFGWNLSVFLSRPLWFPKNIWCILISENLSKQKGGIFLFNEVKVTPLNWLK